MRASFVSPWTFCGTDSVSPRVSGKRVISPFYIFLSCAQVHYLPRNFHRFYRFRIFFAFQWVLFIAQYFATVFIDDVPPEVSVQLERNNFINQKVFFPLSQHCGSDRCDNYFLRRVLA